MASRKEEEPQEFKVVDRRAFTSEGERRPDAPPEPAEPAVPPPAAAPSRQPSGSSAGPGASPATGPSQERPSVAASTPAGTPGGATASSANSATAGTASAAPEARAAAATSLGNSGIPETGAGASPFGPVRFEHLVMSLVSSAMLQLGLAARPGEVALPPDLPAAQETIDILGILQQKTRGNLSREEDDLLNGSLQELRLAFVELSRRAGRVR